MNDFFQGDFKSQKEAAWAVTNLTSGGTITQIIALCQYGVLKPMCELLGARDDKVFFYYEIKLLRGVCILAKWMFSLVCASTESSSPCANS